jgi:alanine racemase
MTAPALATVARPRAGAPTLTVDLGAVAANTRLLAGRATGELMAVVKADGFGHGAVDVARASLAAGATRLGVTSLAEAVVLREAGLAAPVLSWLNPPDADYMIAAAYDIEVGVPSLRHLDAVARLAPGARVHLMLDTGMARDGAAPASWPELCRAARLLERQGSVTVVGLMGHLPCAEEPGHPGNAAARTRFAWGLRQARAAGLRPRDRHLAATAATLTDPQSHHTMCRVGAGLVGIDPSASTRLRPAMRLTAPVVETRDVRAGTPVGYGQTWSAPRATTLGLLPLGYADGLPRLASGRAEVLVRGRRRPVVGRISMDMAVVDLGHEPVRPGELVTVFGPGDAGEPTVAEWAAWAETIEHDIVTGLGRRLRRTVTAAAAGRLALAPALGSLR